MTRTVEEEQLEYEVVGEIDPALIPEEKAEYMARRFLDMIRKYYFGDGKEAVKTDSKALQTT